MARVHDRGVAGGRTERGTTVFFIGAGFAAESGAPLISNFLDRDYQRFASPKRLELLSHLLSHGFPSPADMNIEQAWDFLDRALLEGRKLGLLSPRDLRHHRHNLLLVHNEILSGVYYRVLNLLEAFEGTIGLEGQDLSSTELFVRSPKQWARDLASRGIARHRQAMLLHLYAAPLAEATRALEVLFENEGDREADRRKLARRLTNVIATPIGLPTWEQRRRIFDHRIAKLLGSTSGVYWLGSWSDPDQARMFEALWRLHLAVTESEAMGFVNGWFKTYGCFVKKLRAGDTVITTNYDLFLELAILTANEKVRRRLGNIGFGADFYQYRDPVHPPRYVPGTRVSYETEMSRGYPEQQRVRTSERHWLYLLKLHGSLNWGTCDGCGAVFSTPLDPFKSRFILRFARRKNGAVHLCCAAPRLRPLVVPPMYSKDFNRAPLANIWSAAGSRLRGAARIVAIGQSLAPSDRRVRELFRNAQLGRDGRSWGIVTVYDLRPTPALRSRYKAVFGAASVRTSLSSDAVDAW